MLQSLSIANPQGAAHGLTDASAPAFLIARANANPMEAVAYGVGLELSLARSGDALTAPDWVQLFPAGPEIKARDGRSWTLPNPEALVSAFAANQADLPFDIEHATEIRAPKGEDAPAQGWIKELQVRADRTVWARVEWNPAGAARLTAKEYRYVSPAFRHTKAGEIFAVSSAALVTQPALVMPALAGQGRDNPNDNQEPAMSLLSRMVGALGLAASASEDDVVAAVTSQVSLASATRDPAQFVPAADHQLALTRASTAEGKLTALDTEAKTKAAEGAVDGAIAEGKIAPASREHWISVAHATPDAFEKAMAAQPKVLTPPTDKGKKLPGEGGETDELGLTPQQLSIARDMGLEPKAYAASLKDTAQ